MATDDAPGKAGRRARRAARRAAAGAPPKKRSRKVDIIDGRAVEKGTNVAVGFRPGESTEGTGLRPTVSTPKEEESRFSQSPINPSEGFAGKLGEAELQEFKAGEQEKEKAEKEGGEGLSFYQKYIGGPNQLGLSDTQRQNIGAYESLPFTGKVKYWAETSLMALGIHGEPLIAPFIKLSLNKYIAKLSNKFNVNTYKTGWTDLTEKVFPAGSPATGSRTAKELARYTSPKSEKLVAKIFTNTFGKHPIISALSTGELASLGIGLWAGAESGEGVDFNIDKIFDYAQLVERSGGNAEEAWALYDEAEAFLLDYTNPSVAESVIKYSPVGFLFQIKKKLTGRYKNALFVSRLHKMKRLGLTERDAYDAIQKEEDEKFNQGRIDTETEILRLKQVQRDANTALDKANAAEELRLWEDSQIKLALLKDKLTKENQQFWLDYLKKKIKFQEDYFSGGSSLTFGLL